MNNTEYNSFVRQRTIHPAAVLILATSLLLGACVDTDSGKKDDPVFFGAAGGANGSAGGTSGVSFKW
jgi:hypothetical protein